MTSTYGLNLFDRLHVGHQSLIDTLSHMPNPIAVVTGGEIVGKDLDLESIIQPVDERLVRLNQYLKEEQLDDVINTCTMTEFNQLVSIKGTATFLMYQGPCCDEIREGALEKRVDRR